MLIVMSKSFNGKKESHFSFIIVNKINGRRYTLNGMAKTLLNILFHYEKEI